MLEFVRGRVEAVTDEAAVISVGGIGLRVQMPTGDLARVSGEVTVHTVLQIKEEDVNVYGFLAQRARELFTALLTVSGVGPKAALAEISFHGIDALERAIATGDDDALALAPGVGKKTASRIVLDLRDQVGAIAEAAVPAGKASALADVREGLKSLGYSTQEIQDALGSLPQDGDVPTLMRHALRALGSNEKVGANGDGPAR